MLCCDPAAPKRKGAIQLELQGDVDSRFAPAADAFLNGFETGRDTGAALAVFLAGEPVIDVWAGHRDRRKTEPWARDTLCCVFSSTKGVAALCILQAVAEGSLELDAPIAAYWPEFAAAGKQALTVRHILSHQSGLVGLREPVEANLLYDWDAMCTRLAAEAPWWEPGTQHGYQARTFGFLLGEVLRRATGQRIGDWLRSRMAEPYDLDFWVGLPEPELKRCAQMVPARLKAGAPPPPESVRQLFAAMQDKTTATAAAFQNPSMGPGYMNSTEFRTAELPAMNGHGTARALARLYALSPEILPAELLAQAASTQSLGEDEVLKSLTHFGLGFMLHHPEAPLGRPGAFGHAGAGGSMAFYDPDTELAFCFAMNQMEQGVVNGGQSAQLCAEAVYQCL
ncbi:MAG: serine hydrolase domain-containing protein [Pseudomonadota bacterium]